MKSYLREVWNSVRGCLRGIRSVLESMLLVWTDGHWHLGRLGSVPSWALPSQTLRLQDAIPQSDRKEISAFAESVQNGSQAFLEELKSTIRKVKVANVARQCKRRLVQFSGRQQWSVDEALRFSPPGSRLLRDQFNARWRVWYKGWSRSRSWGWDGDDNSCLRDLIFACWDHHTSITGEPCPISTAPAPKAAPATGSGSASSRQKR